MRFKIPSESVRRGLRLAERRKAHFSELELTGRWRLHFKTEEGFAAKTKAASDSVEQWKRLVADDETPGVLSMEQQP